MALSTHGRPHEVSREQNRVCKLTFRSITPELNFEIHESSSCGAPPVNGEQPEGHHRSDLSYCTKILRQATANFQLFSPKRKKSFLKFTRAHPHLEGNGLRPMYSIHTFVGDTHSQTSHRETSADIVDTSGTPLINTIPSAGQALHERADLILGGG